MVSMSARYVKRKPSGLYWEPTKKMREAGFRPEVLDKDEGAALTRANELNREWDAIRKGEAKIPNVEIRGSMKWLIREYERSALYGDLAPRTKVETDRHLAYIASSPMGKRMIRQINQGKVQEFYDGVYAARGIWVAIEVHKRLQKLLTYAVKRGLITTNPASKMGIKKPRPRRVVWEPAEIAAFVEKAQEMGYRQWALAVLIGYDTGADLSVILSLRWNDFDGVGFDLRRFKTDIAAYCPLSDRTKAFMGVEKTALTVVTWTDGKPVANRTSFARIFREIREETDMRKGVRFKDLRRTAGTEIEAGGGNSEPILGLTPGSAVKKHYVVGNKTASLAAHAARQGAKSGKT